MFQRKKSPDINSNKLFENIDKFKFYPKAKSYRNYKEGDIIYSVGEAADFVYLLIEGEVKVKYTSGQSSSIVLKKIKYDFFGEKEISDKTVRNSSAVAETPTRLYVISFKEFNRLLSKYPPIKQNIKKHFLEGTDLIESGRAGGGIHFIDDRLNRDSDKISADNSVPADPPPQEQNETQNLELPDTDDQVSEPDLTAEMPNDDVLNLTAHSFDEVKINDGFTEGIALISSFLNKEIKTAAADLSNISAASDTSDDLINSINERMSLLLQLSDAVVYLTGTDETPDIKIHNIRPLMDDCLNLLASYALRDGIRLYKKYEITGEVKLNSGLLYQALHQLFRFINANPLPDNSIFICVKPGQTEHSADIEIKYSSGAPLIPLSDDLFSLTPEHPFPGLPLSAAILNLFQGSVKLKTQDNTIFFCIKLPLHEGI